MGIRRWALPQATAILDFAARVHPGALVGKGEQVRADAVIGKHSVICPDSTVGRRALVGACLAVGRRVTIGSDPDLQAGVGLGERSSIGARSGAGNFKVGIDVGKSSIVSRHSSRSSATVAKHDSAPPSNLPSRAAGPTPLMVNR